MDFLEELRADLDAEPGTDDQETPGSVEVRARRAQARVEAQRLVAAEREGQERRERRADIGDGANTFGVDEEAQEAEQRRAADQVAALPGQLGQVAGLAATAAIGGPVVGHIARTVGSGLADAAALARAGHGLGAARALGPAAATVAPVAEAVMLGEKGPPTGGVAGVASDAARGLGARGRRGSFPVPDVKAAAEKAATTFDAAREAVGNLDNPGLSRMPLRGLPGANAGYEAAGARLAKSNVGEVSERLVDDYVVRGSGQTTEQYGALSELPTLLRDIQLLRDGKETAGGKTVQEVVQKILAIKNSTDPAVRAEYLRRYKDVTDDMLKRAQEEGILVGFKPKGFYAPREVLEMQEGRGVGGSGRPNVPIPGFSKQTKGTERENIRDANIALKMYVQDAGRAIADRRFARVMKDNAVNDALRGGQASDDVALYSFKSKQAITNPVAINDLVGKGEFADKRTGARKRMVGYWEDWTGPGKNDLTRELKKAPQDVAPGAPFVSFDEHGVPQDEWYAFPRDAVDDMVRMGEAPTKSHLPWHGLNRFVRRLVTSRPGYLASQIEEDYRTAASNLYPREQGSFAKEAARSTGKFAGEDWRSRRKGDKPKFIMDALLGTKDRYPIANSSFENIRSELIGGPGEKQWSQLNTQERAQRLADLTPAIGVPQPQRSWFGKAVRLPGKAVAKYADFAHDVNELREVAFKDAVASVLEKERGYSGKLATATANERSGNYWRQSELTRKYGELGIFYKWYGESYVQMLRNPAKDPLTGKASMEGFKQGPLAKALVRGALLYAWNKAMWSMAGVPKEKQNLPEGQDGTFGGAILLPDGSGGLAALNLKGHANTLDVLTEVATDAVRAVGGDRYAAQRALTRPFREFASKGAPVERTAFEAITGTRLDNLRRVVPQSKDKMTTAQQEEEILRENPNDPVAQLLGAIPGVNYGYTAQHAVGNMTGGWGRDVSRLASGESLSGLPIPLLNRLRGVDPRQGVLDEGYRNSERLRDEIIAAKSLPLGDAKREEMLKRAKDEARALGVYQSVMLQVQDAMRQNQRAKKTTAEEERERRLQRVPGDKP